MKLYTEQIVVRTARSGVPEQVIWRRHTYAVNRIEETWQYNGEWWGTPHLMGKERQYYRLAATTAQRTPVRLVVFGEAGRWTLSTLQD